MKDKRLHMIGNAHIDPVWLWQWQEGMAEIKATFRSALDRMNEDPQFIFTASSVAFHAWVEENDPAMFQEIRARVAEGRWQIVGGWWVEPDCNLPSGESFARHALYSQRYLRDKFGVMATVGYNVDSFGHSGMLPQLLKKAGMDAYIFMRPSPHEKGLPSRLFWWESDDGSRVLTYRLPYEYVTWGKDVEQQARRCAAELKPPMNEAMCFYGVGNHGGGPTKENLMSIRQLNAAPDMPELVYSSPAQFFESASAQNESIPVVHGDLQHHASGCYSAHSGIKRWNRQAENRLLAAEKLSTMIRTAALCDSDPTRVGERHVQNLLGQAWKNVLFNQFHDVLAGTSIEEAYEDARNSYGEAISVADRVLNDAIQSVSWRIRIEPEEGMKPIVVFNPHAWQVKPNIELELGTMPASAVLLDDQEREVPIQQVHSHGAAPGRQRISFVADLPPLGYRTFRLVPRANAQRLEHMVATDCTIENDYLRLEIDTTTGYLNQLVDKVSQHNVLLNPAKPVVIHDPSDTWGHNVWKFDQVIGEFTVKSVRLVEHGPVKSVIRVMSEYGASRLVQEYALCAGLDQVDVHVAVDWREHFKMLKLRFPLNLNMMTATYEIPYGHIERFANGEEEPMQSWVDVSGVSRDTGALYGLSILNDGKYGADVNVRDIGLTVLRSPIYAHHMPLVPDPEGFYSFIDQGIQHFGYSLLPHAGGWEQAHIVRRAAELNQRPVVIVETFHPQGTLPQSDSYLQVDQGNIIVSVVKQAEDNDDIVLRAYETDQTSTHAAICLPKLGRIIEADYGPCEIKTFRVPRNKSRPVVETNLLEMKGGD